MAKNPEAISVNTSKPTLLALFFLGLIRLYQLCLSPFFGNQCRFQPSCSHYSVEAIQRFGALKGAGLTLQRLVRCNRFFTPGFDPVPTSHTMGCNCDQ